MKSIRVSLKDFLIFIVVLLILNYELLISRYGTDTNMSFYLSFIFEFPCFSISFLLGKPLKFHERYYGGLIQGGDGLDSSL